MRTSNAIVIIAFMAILSLGFVGCSAGGRIGFADAETGTQIEATSSTPMVLGTSKTANASLSPGQIQLFFSMSEALTTPPSMASVVLTEGDLAASVSKAEVVSECDLIDGGERVVCEMTVAGCDTLRDYLVTLSGGANADGDEMESFELILNSADTEARSMEELDVCWTKFEEEDDGEPLPFEDVADLNIVGDSIEWDLLQPVEDLAQANIFKAMLGYTDVAITMKAEAGQLISETGGAMVGIQFSFMAEPQSLSSGYRVFLEGAVATTYTDDGSGSFYIPDFLEEFQAEPDHYYCIVKRMQHFDYFLSTDGVNFTHLTSDNTELYFNATSCTQTPIEAGWECPPEPADVCLEDGDYGGEECSFASYAECVSAAEGIFGDALCEAEDLGEAMGMLYMYPIVRIYGWASSTSSDIPLVDFVRFRSTDLTGVASDCPRVY